MHASEERLVKGDCPSTRKRSQRASIPRRSPLTRRTRTPRVPVHVPPRDALFHGRHFGSTRVCMCQFYAPSLLLSPLPLGSSAVQRPNYQAGGGGGRDGAFASRIPHVCLCPPRLPGEMMPLQGSNDDSAPLAVDRRIELKFW